MPSAAIEEPIQVPPGPSADEKYEILGRLEASMATYRGLATQVAGQLVGAGDGGNGDGSSHFLKALEWPTTISHEYWQAAREELGHAAKARRLAAGERGYEALQRLPRSAALTYQPLQEWEGEVREVGSDRFHCRLWDRTGATADQVTWLPLDDVDEEDLGLLEGGAQFYLSIGYVLRPFRMRTSVIMFRRLPVFSEEDVGRVRERTKSLKSVIGTGESRRD